MLSLVRCHAYLQGDRWEQALKDAQTAISYLSSSSTQDGPHPSYAAAMAAYSNAMEGLQVSLVMLTLLLSAPIFPQSLVQGQVWPGMGGDHAAECMVWDLVQLSKQPLINVTPKRS